MISKLKGAALAALAAFCALPAFAQYTTVSGSHAGPLGAQVTNGTFYWQLASAARIGTSGGQALGVPVTAMVIAGAFTMPASSIVDTSLSNPVNPCYAVTIIDNISGATLLGAGLAPDGVHVNRGGPYGCVQPSGSSWSFDSFIPASAPTAPVVAGPMGPTGITNWRGAWAAYTSYLRNDGYVQGGNGYIVIGAYTSGGSFGSTDTTNSVQVATGCPLSGCTMTGALVQAGPYTSSSSNLNQSATAQNVRNVASISIKEFGAVGDWSTDDTTALTAGLAYALAHNVCLYFPPGGYKTTSQLSWTSMQRLCMRGESAATTWIGYLGSGTVDSAFYISANPLPVMFDIQRLSFAANANASYAFHAIYAGVGTTMDTVGFDGGSVSSFQGDFFNPQGDIRNLMVGPGVFQPSSIPACVNGLSFDQATVSGVTSASSQFTLTSPLVEYCTGIGLNLAHAFEVTVNGGQIAVNHQQLYSNSLLNVYNGVLIENSTSGSVPSQIYDTWSQFNALGQSDLGGSTLTNIYGSHNSFNNSQLRANVEAGANYNEFKHSVILPSSVDAGYGTTGTDNSFGNLLVAGWNKEQVIDNNALGGGSYNPAPVRAQWSLPNAGAGTYNVVQVPGTFSSSYWRLILEQGFSPGTGAGAAGSYEVTSTTPAIAIAGGTITFALNTGTHWLTATIAGATLVYQGWIDFIPGLYNGTQLQPIAKQYSSPIAFGAGSPFFGISATAPTVGAGVCWKTATTLGTCTAGTWPSCSTCN